MGGTDEEVTLNTFNFSPHTGYAGPRDHGE